jgi:hypothetical protein
LDDDEPTRTTEPAAFPWITRLVYVGIAALLEAPLFIALSILYRELKFNRAADLAEPAI